MNLDCLGSSWVVGVTVDGGRYPIFLEGNEMEEKTWLKEEYDEKEMEEIELEPKKRVTMGRKWKGLNWWWSQKLLVTNTIGIAKTRVAWSLLWIQPTDFSGQDKQNLELPM